MTVRCRTIPRTRACRSKPARREDEPLDRWAQARTPAFGDIVRDHAAARPDRTALRFGERALSYVALDRLSNRLARGLQAAGVVRHDRVALLSRNSDDVAVAAVGVAKAGAVFTPVNARLAAPEIEWIVEHSGARALLFGEGFEAFAERLAAQTPGLSALRIDPLDEGAGGWLSADDSDPAVSVDPGEVMLQVYTSGTTGRPKGVMLTHRNVFGVNALRAGVPWDSWSFEDVVLQALPLGHMGGFAMLARALYFGAESVILREFEAGAVLDAVDRLGISKIALVPTAIAMLLEHPRVREVDYGRINTFIYGAAPITFELLREATAVFGCGFAQSYGLSETAATIVALAPEDHVEGSPRMRSAGQALPGVELRIVDPEGAVLASGEVGEVSVRSIANMAGYADDPAATAEVMEGNGWMRTGDAGWLDADGYLFVCDRIKDVIITGASNVYPAEVESAIYGHPDVAQVAVIGVPDAKWGETVKAVVIPRAGRTVDADSVIAWARERIAAYKAPRSVDVVDAFPLNASGKVLRRELRRPYWGDVDRRI